MRGGDALALEVKILAARCGGAVYINIVYAVERGQAQVVGVEHLDIGAVAVLVRTVHEGHDAEVALVPRFGNGSRKALAVSISLPLNGFAQRGRERYAVHVVVYLRAAARLLADGFHGIFHQLHGEVGFGIEKVEQAVALAAHRGGQRAGGSIEGSIDVHAHERRRLGAVVEARQQGGLAFRRVHVADAAARGGTAVAERQHGAVERRHGRRAYAVDA